MENTYKRMMQVKDFQLFVEQFTRSANFFMAVNADPADAQASKRDCVLLCMAYAFEAGQKASALRER